MWKNHQYKSSHKIKTIRFYLLILITILLPVTMFFAGFGWYDSWEVHITHDPGLLNKTIYFEHGIVAGSTTLTFSLSLILLVVLLDLKIQQLDYFWQIFLARGLIIIFTVLFFVGESISVVFICYFLTPWLILALILFPVLYLAIMTEIMLNQKTHNYLHDYFPNYNKHKR